MGQKFTFFAGRDFDTRNLKCRKGDRLPDRWQEPVLVKKLREQHGEKAVVAREESVQRKDEGVDLLAAAAAKAYQKK